MIEKHSEPTDPRTISTVLGVWIFALAMLVLIRLRVSWPAYVQMHQWLADNNTPAFVRSLDYPLLMLIPVVLGAIVIRVRTGTPSRACLALRWPSMGWVKMISLAAAPMVVGGFVLMLIRGVEPSVGDVFGGVVRAPVLEELFFRGLLVGVAFTALGGGPRVFWRFAAAGAVVFGMIHVEWSVDGLMSGWPNLLVTAMGGVWYAWLMREWRSLLIPVLLHSAMNLGWILAGAAAAGGGGWIENALRTATIATATVLTLRMARNADPSR